MKLTIVACALTGALLLLAQPSTSQPAKSGATVEDTQVMQPATTGHPVKGGGTVNSVENVCDPPLHKVLVNGTWQCAAGNGQIVRGNLGGPARMSGPKTPKHAGAAVNGDH